MRIGVRLALAFTAIVLITLAGSLFTFRQARINREHVRASLAADTKQLAIMRVHADVLQILTSLSPPILNRDLAGFAHNAATVKRTVVDDIARAKHAIANSPSTPEADAKLLALLQTSEDTVSEQINLLSQLGAAGDWDALQLRFTTQTESLAALTSVAADTVNAEVSSRRTEALRELHTTQDRLLWIVALSTLLSVLVAAGVGAKVTSGITRPLRDLETAARKLASGELVPPVSAADEIATLSNAFNFATAKLQSLNDALADVNHRLIVAQEEERARIARELHDDFGQRIAALAMALSNVKRQIPHEPAGVDQQAAKIYDGLRHLGESLRRLSHTLHPATLQYCGLPVALKSLCSEYPGLHVSLTIAQDPECKELPPDIGLCLYRVAQESLSNIVKHAGVTEAEMSLSCTPETVTLLVQDRGKPRQSASKPAGLGLVSMRERVRQHGGVFSFQSAPDSGTRVLASIPVRVSVY